MANSKISALTSATTPLAGTEVLPVVQSSATTQVTVANLTAGRAVSATQYTSTIATGTAPLVVSSTTNVANLNASSLGGATFAAPGAIGGGTASAITGTTIAGTDTTDATSTTAAALKTAGGLAVVKKTYIGDNIVQGVAAKGINFTANTPAAGMTSQLLNWYEEGTWTMGLSFGGGTTGITYVVNTGRYIRIGKSVTVTGLLLLSNKGSSTGAAAITGLPYTIGAGNNSQSAAAVRLANSTFVGQYHAVGNIGATTIAFGADTELGVASSLTNTNFANNSLIQISYTYFVD